MASSSSDSGGGGGGVEVDGGAAATGARSDAGVGVAEGDEEGVADCSAPASPPDFFSI